MFNILFIVIIAAFIAMLFINVFFRVKILKLHKYLVQNNIEFNSSHFFNEDKLKSEVLNRYKGHEPQILDFIKMIKQSVTLASGLIFLILAFGYLLMKFR